MRFDALVLLGCRVDPAGLPGAAARRVRRATEAFLAGLAPRVIVSGGRAWQGLVEADALGQALRDAGVPSEALTLERRSRSTRDNARFTAALLGELGLGHGAVGLVSCDWHLPRALYCFRRAGVEAEPLPAPSGNATDPWTRVVREQGAWLLDRLVTLAW